MQIIILRRDNGIFSKGRRLRQFIPRLRRTHVLKLEAERSLEMNKSYLTHRLVHDVLNITSRNITSCTHRDSIFSAQRSGVNKEKCYCTKCQPIFNYHLFKKADEDCACQQSNNSVIKPILPSPADTPPNLHQISSSVLSSRSSVFPFPFPSHPYTIRLLQIIFDASFPPT